MKPRIFLPLLLCLVAPALPAQTASAPTLANREWRLVARSGGHAETSAAGLHLRVEQGKKPVTVEAVSTQPISVSERFAVTLKARFLKLGLEDDSTGEKSNLRFSLGARTPSGDFGLGFLFMGDRYKVDGSYKVVRTDAEWHTWRFEADTVRKTVAMFRDGAYVCLHAAGSRQPSGLRFRVQGTTAVPADVEIAELTIDNLPALETPARRAQPAKTPEFSAGEWPLWRRDAQNTALSPMKGNIKRPRIAWQIPVSEMAPLPTYLDLDGDGTKEALISQGGNLTAYRLGGSQLWRRFVEYANIFGVYDLDEDGKKELIITSGSPSRVQILDARTGVPRYTCSLYPMAGVSGIRIAKLSPKQRGLQAVVWSPQHEIGFCLAFENGVENARVAWKFNWRVTNFSPAVVLSDMDRDGVLDVVVTTYDRAFVFDGGNGKTKMDLEWPSGRNYGTTVVQDVDNDGYPDVVVLADYLREHIGVLKNEGGKSLKFLWDNFYEQNYPDDFKTLRLTVDSVGDFDGDGRTEIAGALYDSKADSVWQTFLLDALTGKVKQTIPGRYLVGAGKLFPNQPPVLLLSTPTNRADLNLQRVAAWAYREGQWRQQAALPEGTLLAAFSIRDFPLNAWTTTQVNTTLLRPLCASHPKPGIFLARTGAANGEAAVTFLTGDSDGRLATAWKSAPSGSGPTLASSLSVDATRPRRQSGADQVTGSVLDVAEVVPGTNEPQLLAAQPDSSLRVVGSDGKVYGELRARAGYITQPVVARLRKDEPPSILFQDSGGRVRCWRADRPGETPRLRWTVEGTGSRPYMVTYLDTQGAPTIQDWDGDGEREIFVARQPNRLVALDADGKEKASWTFPAMPSRWTFGHFDDDDQLDLFVAYPSGAFVDMTSVVVSGKDGKTVWKSDCGNGYPAVVDLNGDGRDDILLRDLFERRTLNAVTGRDIFPITMWAGYHTPVILPLQGEKQLPGVAWVSGTYSVVAEGAIGKQSWWRPFRPTGPQAVADVDNDGRYEIGGITAGQLYNWPKFYAVDGPDKEFLCYDALTGRVKWTQPLGVTSAGALAADVDGDGKKEFVLSMMDGRLLALRGETTAASRVLWQLSLPAALGPSIACDAAGDGTMAILVSCSDGQLYCIQ